MSTTKRPQTHQLILSQCVHFHWSHSNCSDNSLCSAWSLWENVIFQEKLAPKPACWSPSLCREDCKLSLPCLICPELIHDIVWGSVPWNEPQNIDVSACCQEGQSRWPQKAHLPSWEWWWRWHYSICCTCWYVQALDDRVYPLPQDIRGSSG